MCFCISLVFFTRTISGFNLQNFVCFCIWLMMLTHVQFIILEDSCWVVVCCCLIMFLNVNRWTFTFTDVKEKKKKISSKFVGTFHWAAASSKTGPATIFLRNAANTTQTKIRRLVHPHFEGLFKKHQTAASQ